MSAKSLRHYPTACKIVDDSPPSPFCAPLSQEPDASHLGYQSQYLKDDSPVPLLTSESTHRLSHTSPDHSPQSPVIHVESIVIDRKRKATTSLPAASSRRKRKAPIAHSLSPPNNNSSEDTKETHSPEDFPETKGYTYLETAGHGSFGTVYKAIETNDKGEQRIVALKRLQPTLRVQSINTEITMLKMLGGQCYVPNLYRTISGTTGSSRELQVTLVLDYFEHTKFREYLSDMTLLEVRSYMKALFTSLGHLHTHHVVHRDIKPGNFLYNRRTGEFMLIDFGLAAQADHPQQSHRLRFITHRQRRQSTPGPGTSLAPSINYYVPRNVPFPTTFSSAISSSFASSVASSGLPSAASPAASSVLPSSPLGASKPSCSRLLLSPLNSRQAKTKSSLLHVATPQRTTVATVPPRCVGTRGFRAPEILFTCSRTNLTISDIWSAGVILLTILTKRYPFFGSPDSLTSLAEINEVVGSQRLEGAAQALGMRVTVPSRPKQDLRQLCDRLHHGQRSFDLSDTIVDLLDRCLDPNPFTRISAQQALSHPFFTES